jgi:hypothetical protein
MKQVFRVYSLLAVGVVACQPLNAQLMVQFSGGANQLLGGMGQEYRTGFGAEFLTRYRFEKPWALGGGLAWWTNRLDAGNREVNFFQMPVTVFSEYYFLTGTFRPYAGGELGWALWGKERGFERSSGGDLLAGAYAGCFILASPGLALDVRLKYQHLATGNAARRRFEGIDYPGNVLGNLGLLVGVIIPLTKSADVYYYD